MAGIFYIQAIRSGRLNPSVVVDWIMVRSEELGPVKRQARMLAQTATDSAWIWPRAEAIRIMGTVSNDSAAGVGSHYGNPNDARLLYRKL